MKLTKQECEIILKAVELIETGEVKYACLAIDQAHRRLSALTVRFSQFYGFRPYSFWGLDTDNDNECKEWRMNNLLLFMYAESEGEGI